MEKYIISGRFFSFNFAILFLHFATPYNGIFPGTNDLYDSVINITDIFTKFSCAILY